MQFKDLIDDVKKVKIDEVRVDSSNFFEAVVARDGFAKVATHLEKFFGVSPWAFNDPLPSEIQGHINSYGGIMPGQTLYFCDSGNAIVIAMLWPWRDGLHTTLKIIECQEARGRK